MLRSILALMLSLAALPGAAETPGRVTIVALGDSLTAGFGVPEGQGLVPQLQRWLDAEGAGARVLNRGVSGDTTGMARARVARALVPEADALIVTLGGNDMLRADDPAITRQNLVAILNEARARRLPVLLIGLRVPRGFSENFKTRFDMIYPELAQRYATQLIPNFSPPIMRRDATGIRSEFTSDGVHPNARGVALVVDMLGPEVLTLIDRARR